MSPPAPQALGIGRTPYFAGSCCGGPSSRRRMGGRRVVGCGGPPAGQFARALEWHIHPQRSGLHRSSRLETRDVRHPQGNRSRRGRTTTDINGPGARHRPGAPRGHRRHRWSRDGDRRCCRCAAGARTVRACRCAGRVTGFGRSTRTSVGRRSVAAAGSRCGNAASDDQPEKQGWVRRGQELGRVVEDSHHRKLATIRRVDSSEMRAWGGSLTHEGMRALGAPAAPAPAGRLGPDDGTDDGATAGGHEDERDPVQAR